MSSVTRSGKSMRVRCRTGKPPHWPSRIDTKRNAVPGRRMDLWAGRPRFAVVRGCRSGRFRTCWRLGAQRLDARARPAPPGAGGVPNCRWFPVISNQFQSLLEKYEKRRSISMRVRCRTGKPPHWSSRIDTNEMPLRAGVWTCGRAARASRWCAVAAAEGSGRAGGWGRNGWTRGRGQLRPGRAGSPISGGFQ